MDFFVWLTGLEKWEPPEEWIGDEERAARLDAEAKRDTYDDPAIRRVGRLDHNTLRTQSGMLSAASPVRLMRIMREQDRDEEMER